MPGPLHGLLGVLVFTMEQAGPFERLRGLDNQALTLRLFENINSFHAVPRLRQKLAKIAFAEFESQVPHAMERDVAYLLSGLNLMLGLALSTRDHPGLARELGEFLRRCDSNGLSIHHFLTRSAKDWADIRPKYQESSRAELGRELTKCFPALEVETADLCAGYLLAKALARLVPPFSFHDESHSRSVMALRAQPDLSWNLCAGPADALATVETHFPEIAWRKGCRSRSLSLVGVRLLSQFSPKTASVLKQALGQLDHISTSLVQNRRRTLHTAFFSEMDASLFKFNLHHHATLAGTLCDLFALDLETFRSGYPGLSGFVEEEMRQETNR